MARSEYYVRPTNGNDTNAGTSHAAAWKTVQHALDTITMDSTDGDRINICDESTLTLASVWSLTPYGNPGKKGLIFQGYTSAAGDGGIFYVDANLQKVLNHSGHDYISLIDGKITNWDVANLAIRLDNGCNLINMRFESDGSQVKVVRLDNEGIIQGCVFKGLKDDATTAKNIQLANYFTFINNYVEVPEDNIGIQAGKASSIIGNMFVLDPSADTGLKLNNASHALVANNTFLASASCSGKGISLAGTITYGGTIINNYFEGFSDSGYGIYGSHANNINLLLSNNYYYNNTTNESQVADTVRVINGPVTLSSSGVRNNAWVSGNFDLSPTKVLINNALVTQIALGDTVHSKDVGAVQRAKGVIGGPNMQAGRSR